VLPEQSEILDVFRRFLEGMEQRRPDTLPDLVLPNGTMTRASDGEHRQITIAELLDMFPKTGNATLEERIYDPIVHSDGAIAVIWCRYDFRVDGEVRHAGSNIVNLVRTNGRWLISGLSDSARPASLD
jgi:hypothetical protein